MPVTAINIALVFKVPINALSPVRQTCVVSSKAFKFNILYSVFELSPPPTATVVRVFPFRKVLKHSIKKN